MMIWNTGLRYQLFAVFCLAFLYLSGFGITSVRCSTGDSGDDDSFAIQHVTTNLCLVGNVTSVSSSLSLANCSTSTAPSKLELWKWGAGSRLFHVDSALCLSLEVHTKELRLADCDSTDTMLSWQCVGQAIYTDYEMGLVRSGETSVKAKRKPPDTWKRAGTEGNICQQPYKMIHTKAGNALGAPCVFPFRYNGSWYHGCLPGRPGDEKLSENKGWCSTSMNYDQQQQWGFCLQKVDGCDTFWQELGDQCYQRVPTAAVTWHEARDSCRSQGGDLLSVATADELHALGAMQLPDELWIGLNQMDWDEGWQWSDGTPLSVMNWASGMPVSVGIGELDCGVLLTKHYYGSARCERRLPYMCKKPVNPKSQPTDKTVYRSVECEKGWFGWEGRCLRLFNETFLPQAKAMDACSSLNASLLSIHSLDDMLLFNTHLPGMSVDMWTGLMGGNESPLQFSWVDNTPVTYTHWAKDNPRITPVTRLPTCVRFTGKGHHWVVSDCELSLPYLCSKKGVVSESTQDEGCPPGNWKRHGNACYKVDPTPVSFKQSCNLTVMDRFEQMFINRLLREQLGNSTRYFWTGLQDIKGTGEFSWSNGENITHTNWAWRQPDMTGGSCVVMSTGYPLGRWVTRNCSLFEAGTICKKYLTTPSQTTPIVNMSAPCAHGWVSKPGLPHCYKVFHEERLSRKRTWIEAEGFCRSLGAHLPSLSNLDEMTALHQVMRNSISDDRFFWVGLNRRNPNNDNAWEWSDGRPMSTSIFPPEFHEDDDYNRDCTAFKSLRGSFHLLFVFLLHDMPPRPFYPKPFHCDAQLEWACQIPRGVSPLEPVWYNPDGHHETSLFVDGHEFWFVTSPELSYEEASLYCSSNGSRLAAPTSINAAAAMQERMKKLSRSKYLNWWADLKEPGPYVPLPFTQMHFYHSTFLGRCPAFSQESFIPEYNNLCSTQLPFVCELVNITTTEQEPIGPHRDGLPCDASSIAFRDKCYTVVKPMEVTFRKASEICQSHRGQLLTIRDQVEQDFITSLLPSLPQRTWIGLKLKFHEMEWADNSPVNYINFHPLVHGQYRRMHINTFAPDTLELCTFIFSDSDSDVLGTWDYTACSDFQNISICQHYADVPEKPVISDKPFTLFNHTYQLVKGENLTWYDALERCKDEDMELVSIADGFQQALLTVNVSRLGKPTWIGLFSDNGEHFRWTDKSHTLFSRWSKDGTAGRCVYLDTDGFWKATECDQGLDAAICHFPPSDTSDPVEDTMKCPHKGSGPNWFPYKNNCYTFQLLHSRWDHHDNGDIQKTCQILDPAASLLTIRDEEENEFLRQKLLPLRDLAHFVWLGMYMDNTTKQLKWFDDTYVQYSNWKGGRPQVEGDFLAGLGLEGRWDLFSNQHYFQHFKQRSVVACKIERTSQEEFRKSPWEPRQLANQSYHIVGRKLNWFQAQEECAQSGGHLASIHNKAQNAELLSMARKDGFPLWIGLSNQDVSLGNGSIYEWSDGSRFDFRPAGFHKDSVVDGCVFMDTSGIWTTIRCQEKMEGALCYNNTGERTSAQKSPESPRCPKTNGALRWVEHDQHCYAFDMAFYNYTIYSLHDARSVCRELDSSAHLLSIKSEAENDFISKYIRNNFHITSRVWLGMESNQKTLEFRWMDDSKVDFAKWTSAPRVSQHAGGTLAPNLCVVMLAHEGGVWMQTNCQESRSRIVCKTAMQSSGMSAGVIFSIIVILVLMGLALFVVYKKTRHHFFSSVRYQRSFDEVDSTSIINDTE